MQILCKGTARIGASLPQNQAVHQLHSVLIGCFKVNLPLPAYKPITQLAILVGIIKSQREQILLEIEDQEGVTLMEGPLFQSIYRLCKESKSSPVHYVAFEAMKQWLVCIKALLKRKQLYKSVHWRTKLDSHLTRDLIGLIWENLEDSIEGVPSLAVTLFDLFLQWHKEEEIARDSVDEQLYRSLMNKILGLPWHVKGRYGLLCSLVHYVELQNIFQAHPAILDDLIHCLGLNQLTSVSTSAFKAFLEKGRLLQKNACLYWLPCVLKLFPEYLTSILKELKDVCDKAEDRAIVSLAFLSVLKVGRSLALLQAEDLEENSLSEGLTHLHNDIRATALSVISFTPKTAEPLSTMEQRLLKDFLPNNLNIACAPFRQTLFVSMKKILGRVRDSCLILLKDHHQVATQEEMDSVLPHTVDEMLKFVDWLFELVMGCFFPGASYQRQKTAMQLLVAIFDVFSLNFQPGKKKVQAPASCHLLISSANRHGYFQFFSIRSAVILLGCVESSYTDIRDAAVIILQEHFSWPLKILENDSTGVSSARMLVQKAVTLAKSPKVQDCEKGAVLFQLIHSRYVSMLGWEFRLSTQEIKPPTLDKLPSGQTTIHMLHEVLGELKVHFEAAQKDLKLASKNEPGHGISLAMAHCIQELSLDVISEENQIELQMVIQLIVDIANNIIIFMLDVLSGSHNTATIGGASFADIGEALDEIVSLSMTDDDEGSEKMYSVDIHKDMVISCCWLNIKCACHLLAVIFEKTITQLKHLPAIQLLREETLRNVAETTWKVIMQCRHQGVVQHCRSSFLKIYRCLFQSSLPCLHSVPKEWLDDMLKTVSLSSSQTSITRRSAGLPVLFSSILACEPNSGQRLLLKQSMKSLLDIASLPIPAVTDQHLDLSQVHAINILKLLYQDTSLGCEVLQYASQGTIMAIGGFASSSWAVRNASMQLFGSLVKRMLGQRRSGDDETEMNTISSSDFFNSFPALRKFFIAHLQNTSQSADSSAKQFFKISKPELFPILTLLSKLHSYSKFDESSVSLLSEFVPHLMLLTSSPSHTERVIAAKALVPFIPRENLLERVEELVKLLPSPEPTKGFSQNVLHGILLQIDAILEIVPYSAIEEKASGLVKEMLKKSWICSLRNHCPLTRAAFLNTLMKYFFYFLKECERDVNILKSVVLDSLRVPAAEAVHSLLCEAQWQREVVRACIHFEFYHPRSKEQESQLSQLMLSTNKERRFAALEYLFNESQQMPGSVLTDLVTCVIHETDHCCLLSALDLFVKGCAHSDVCFPTNANVRELWNKLTSLAKKLRGVTVAGKAIPACGLILRHSINMSVLPTIPLELQEMLNQWRELIQTNCDWEQDELLRQGTVQSLKLCGVAILSSVLTSTGETGLPKYSYLVETAISVLSSTLCLLQDEEEEIRFEAAEFVAMITEPTKSLTCTAAVKRVFQLMVEHFWSVPGCWESMETMIRGLKSTADVLKGYLGARLMLFEQEDANLYVEPVILMTMVVNYFKRILNQLIGSGEVELREYFHNWFIARCDQLTKDLQELKQSGIKEFGSLSNPKPFVVRFRMMCMAEVLWFAVDNSLRSDCSLSVINGVNEPLVDMLEEIIQVKDTAHPWLIKCASDLLIVVRKPMDNNLS
ncbi:Thyroid adenoma-associated protein-like [Stylophora pistillata]|uniref:Thyroid adenoma-associated protein-like n=1 Tax=Stylophora pistillata TaxID=50429 RepID=A0A2B4RLU8_STYPI|nr:Thyroid adenoma-associated protein-like [Stylophora pistillata]